MAFGRQLHQAERQFRTLRNWNFKVRNSHQPMQVRISHQPMRLWYEISSVLPTPHEIFSSVFFDVNSFLIPVISQSQALLCKDYKRGGNHLSKTCKNFTLRRIFLSGRKIQGSLCFPFLFSIFFFLEAKQPLRMFSQRMRG